MTVHTSNRKPFWGIGDRSSKRSVNEGMAMSNVIEFKRPPKPKEKKKLQPFARRALLFVGVCLAFALIWAYYAYLA